MSTMPLEEGMIKVGDQVKVRGQLLELRRRNGVPTTGVVTEVFESNQGQYVAFKHGERVASCLAQHLELIKEAPKWQPYATSSKRIT